ncbi:FKBP-type peptidyl-prolyl cis-trans isomerase [Yokenella regensburgei]|uniref:FKBP-type peptidyl-prolyl cis-trans isomerase N-terminal domain-containing protein n=1 Tax=Yokenella regensburgei TaxID=158877 RepID=UPI003F13C752
MLIPEPTTLFNQPEATAQNNPPPSPVIAPEKAPATESSTCKIKPASVKDTPVSSGHALTELKRQLSKTRNQLNALNKKYQALLASPPQALSEEATSFRDENKQLHQQLLAAEKQIADSRRRDDKEIDTLNRQVEELKARVASTSATLARHQADRSVCEQQQATLAERDNTLVQLTAKLAEAEKGKEEWADRLRALQEKATAQEARNRALEQQNEEAARAHATLSQRLKEAQGEVTALRQQQVARTDHSKATQALETELARTAQARDDAMKDSEEKRQKIAELEKTVMQARNENSEMAKRLTTLDAEIKASAERDKANAPSFSMKKKPSENAQTNYALGIYYATQVRSEIKVLEEAGYQYRVNALVQGIEDELQNRPQLSQADIHTLLARLDSKVAEKHSRESTSNQQQSERFVAQAEKAKGAEKVANGVVYQVLRKGSGPLLAADDVIHFTLNEKLSTGKVMAKGERRTGQVSRLPDLMQQGIRRLGVGGKVKITVPWQLAYGEKGIPGTVPPGVASELTLEVTGKTK